MTLTEELNEWVGEQPLWQQDLAVRLLGRSHVEADEYETALRVVVEAHGALEDGETSPAPRPIRLEDFPAAAREGDAPRLASFGRLRGVGALSPAGELQFRTTGLTVVFGANAAGKSTYVRALKRVCRAVDCEDALLGNVFGDDAGEQTAALETVTGAGEPFARQVDLRSPNEPAMSAVSVFDARCAELYVDTQNAVAYVPSALMLLARLATTQDRMRTDVQQRLSRARARLPRFDDVSAGTEACGWVDALSLDSNVSELEASSTLSGDEHGRLVDLRAAVAVADGPSAADDAGAAERDARQARELANALDLVTAAVSGEAVEALAALAREASLTEEAAAAAAAQFDGMPMQGVGGDAWRLMWEAARSFAKAQSAENATFPPAADEACPLCMQPVGDAAGARMTHMETHVRSQLSADATIASDALVAALAALRGAAVRGWHGAFAEALRQSDEQLAAATDEFVASANARLSSLHDSPEGQAPQLCDDPRERLRGWAAQRLAHAETLRAAAQPSQAADVRAELAELEARVALGARMSDVRAAVAEFARIKGLEAAYSDLNTNRVTRRQRELSAVAVTDVLERNLGEELAALNCQHVPVELTASAAAGATLVSLGLAGAAGSPRVSDILSEGEQRALSLAFFFAEVATAEDDGGVVVDDPVSSLDDERRAYIARRLVEEARGRQVIVFTHDLPFVVDLRDQAKKLDVPLGNQWVWRDGNEPGRVDAEPPFSAMNFRSRVGKLSQRVERWNNQDAPANQDEAGRRVADLYRDMRSTWERGVEERLFRGVVQRFQREVKTSSLSQVKVTDDLKRAVEDGMTRCSQYLHDAAEGTLTTIPGRTALAADVEALVQFDRDTRQAG